MAKQSYSFDPGGPKRLEMSWKGAFKETTLVVDGVPVGVIPDQKALRAGQEFKLVDGSLLKVQLVSNLAGSEVQVTRNGMPLPGSASNPETRIKTAAGIIFFIAGLNLLLGLLALVIRSDFFASLGIGWYNLVFGLFFLAMGFLVNRKSKVALIAATVVFALDALIGIVGSIAAGYTPPIFGLILRVILIIPMVQGIGAISASKRDSLPPSTPTYIPPA